MKKIIEDIPESNVIYLKDVLEKTEFPNVAFLFDGQKGFLIPIHFFSFHKDIVHYSARAVKQFSRGNGWNLSQTKTLKEWKNFFGKEAEFFLFENEKEMFKWLSE